MRIFRSKSEAEEAPMADLRKEDFSLRDLKWSSHVDCSFGS